MVKSVPIENRGCFFYDPFFKNNWDKFDRLKERIVKVSETPWNKFKIHCHDIPFFSYRGGEKDGDSLDVIKFPQKSMLPGLPGVQENCDLYKSTDPELVRWKEDVNGVEITLDTHQFTPKDIHVVAEDDRIDVFLIHEARSTDLKMNMSKETQKTYILPDPVNPDEIYSNLSADGVLVIYAVKPGAKLRYPRTEENVSEVAAEPETKKFKFSPNFIFDNMDVGDLMSTGML